MHAHGVRHPQPLPLPELPRDPIARNNTAVRSFALNNDPSAIEDSATNIVDPDGANEGEKGTLAPPAQTRRGLDSSSAPVPDLTVEPMIYGSTGKIRFLQNKAGQRASGQA